MDNTHQWSIRLEKVFSNRLGDFANHIADEFDQDMYEAIVFWSGVLVGINIAGKQIAINNPTANELKNEFMSLKARIEDFKGVKWQEIDEINRESIIEYVKAFVQFVEDAQF